MSRYARHMLRATAHLDEESGWRVFVSSLAILARRRPEDAVRQARQIGADDELVAWLQAGAP